MSAEARARREAARRDWLERVGQRRSDGASAVALPRLAVPGGLRASEGRGQVTLRWEPVEGAAGYLIRRADAADGPFEPMAVGEPIVKPVPDVVFTDTTGRPGAPAWYRVSAAASIEDDGQPASMTVTATPATDGDGKVLAVVDAGSSDGRLPRPWRPIVGSEHLSLLTYGAGAGGVAIGPDLAEALRIAHDELGIEAVRAHAILHDELGVYRELDGRAMFDFSRIGALYDQVLVTGLRPIVELSFMPRDLARDPSKTVFQYDAIVSPPRSMQRWGELIAALVAYLVDRYGRDEVRSWGFEVWNEANLEVFWSGTRDEYLELYDVSAAAVKSIDRNLLVGGPATAAVGWLDELLAHARDSGAPVDFLSTHTYGNSPMDLRPIAARHGYAGLPLWWTEWGAHATHNNPLHDSVWAAGYLVRGMRSAMGRIESLAYWVISDQFEELGWPQRLLHGGFGLLTVGNLRKPRFWGLWMLERLGDERLAAEIMGDGAGDMVNLLATRDEAGRIAILVWNTTIDSSKAGGDALLDRHLSIRLDHLPMTRYRSRHRRLDRDHSNLAATWEQMGGGNWPNDEQWALLTASDELRDFEPEREVRVNRGAASLELDLPMPAISLLELTPVRSANASPP
jgi:xylan 1,4-beta-xylosidase